MAAASLGAGALEARAAPSLVTHSYSLSAFSGEPDVAIAGPATLVGTRRGEATDVVRSFTAGQPPSPLAGATLRTKEQSTWSTLAASPTRLIALVHGSTPGYKGTGGSSSEELVSGPISASLTPLTAGCLLSPGIDPSARSEDGLRQHTAFAISGEVVAYDSFGCVVVRDFATGLQRIVTLDATLQPVQDGAVSGSSRLTLLRVAGRLIAYRANPPGGEGPGKVVVYDIDAARALYSVALPATDEDFGGSPTFDLQPDGTLLIAGPDTCAATVSTVTEPVPRPLGIAVCAVRRVRDGRALVLVPGPDRHRLLAWATLQAPAVHEVADLGRDGALEASPSDMNETDVVYTLGGCRYPSVYRTSLLDPGLPPAVPSSCPVLVSRHSATLTKGSLRVRLECPLGCSGELFAAIGTPAALRGEHGADVSVYGEGYVLAPGRAKTLDLLDSEGVNISAARIRHELRRNHRLRLGIYFATDRPEAQGLGYGEGEAQRHTEAIVPVKLAR
ncbi:MAG TPA: hypothetical protein VGI27_04145 [Solirubrobacteraceae bacterium]